MESSERVPGVAAAVAASVVRADEGEAIVAAGVQHLFKLTGVHTGGRLGVEQFEVPAATLGARPHVHREHDEYFYVLHGELTVATCTPRPGTSGTSATCMRRWRLAPS